MARSWPLQQRTEKFTVAITSARISAHDKSIQNIRYVFGCNRDGHANSCGEEVSYFTASDGGSWRVVGAEVGAGTLHTSRWRASQNRIAGMRHFPARNRPIAALVGDQLRGRRLPCAAGLLPGGPQGAIWPG